MPEGVTTDAWHLLALFVGVVAAIYGKAMPIGAVAMLAITLVAVTGVTSDSPAQAAKSALSSFNSPLIWMIGRGDLSISRGLLRENRLGRALWLYVYRRVGQTHIGHRLQPSDFRLAARPR